MLWRLLILALSLTTAISPAEAAVHTKKLAVIHINPVNPSNPNQTVISKLGWPAPLTTQVIDTISRATNGRVAYQATNNYTVTTFPARNDGQVWTWDNYIQCATAPGGRFPQGFCTPGNGGYNALMTSMTNTNLCQKISSGEIDEVWIWAPYYTGFDEFAYKTPNDKLYYTSKENNYWLYDGRRYDLPDCGRPYVVMGFVAEAGIGNTIHSYGHRIESMLSLSAPGQGYFDACAVNNPAAKNEWTDFVCYNKLKVGAAGCGNVHFPPNALNDYEYGSFSQVTSSCDDWKTYPTRNGTTKLVNVQTWMQTGTQPFAGNDQASYLEWWLNHIPHADGFHVDANGVKVANDWWTYILNYQDPYNTITNQPPVANAGMDIYASVSIPVTLQGNSSVDPDGTIVSYVWSNGLTGPNPQITFTTSGDRTLTLTVTDNNGATATDSVVIHVGGFSHDLPQVHLRGTNNNWAAGTMMISTGNYTWESIVTFGSTTSERFKFDANGDWSQNYGDTNRDGIAERTGADIPVTTGAGSYKITFNDHTLQYTVTKQQTANQTPIARAGSDFTVTGPVGTVTLNASTSSDPDGDALTYSWIQTAGRPLTLSNASTATPSFVLNAEPIGTSSNPDDSFEFKVTVNDGRGATASDYVMVTHAHSPSTVQITMKPNATTTLGQNIYIIGNKAELSNWNTAAGVPCTTDAASYPVWTCQGFNLTPGTVFEYKYIKRNAAGTVIWESGTNRVRTTPAVNTTYSETWK